jgi:hypothetical protein
MDKNKEPKIRGTRYEHADQYRSDLAIHDQFIVEFDGSEAMLVSKTYDTVSKQTKNGITDGDAATMVIERSARVVGQLPDGEVTAAGKKDKGKALFMDILRQKWIYPNANAQRPFLDKIRLWEMYSGVYGEMPMYYDWDISPSGYIGPNCWLWSPRNFIPQQGRYTIADMDYVHAVAYMGKADIDELIEEWSQEDGWDLQALKELQGMVKKQSKEQDTSRTSYVERNRISGAVSDRIPFVTRYEAGDDGHWITFAPDYGSLQLRDIENPHKNAKIPFVIKPAIPLFDSFYNLSDMARAKPIQFAKDGLTNFYFQGIKMNIYPPTVVNAQGILKHTVSNDPGSIWEEIIPNSARRLETSTAGLATYQAAMGQMAGALQNVFGTTTTQLNAEQAMSPTMGKTPEAIKYQSGRESARDNQNRAYLQSAIEELMDGMMSLIPTMGTEKIPIDLFSEDIMAIAEAGYEDVLNLLIPNESGNTGRIVLDPKQLKGVEYRFNMEPNSTVKADKTQQRADIKDVMDTLSNSANILQSIQQTTGEIPNYKELITTYVALADLPIKDPWIKAPPPQDPNDHPVVKLMDILQIKFETLGPDVQSKIIETIFGVQPQMPTSTQQELAIKQQEADTKTAQAHTAAHAAGADSVAKLLKASQPAPVNTKPITAPKKVKA